MGLLLQTRHMVSVSVKWKKSRKCCASLVKLCKIIRHGQCTCCHQWKTLKYIMVKKRRKSVNYSTDSSAQIYTSIGVKNLSAKINNEERVREDIPENALFVAYY